MECWGTRTPGGPTEKGSAWETKVFGFSRPAFRETLPRLARPDNLSEKHDCSQRARGIYGLGIGVLWSWKESQRFYGPVGFFSADKLFLFC